MVLSAVQMTGSIVSGSKGVEASANTAMTPPGCRLRAAAHTSPSAVSSVQNIASVIGIFVFSHIGILSLRVAVFGVPLAVNDEAPIAGAIQAPRPSNCESQ